MDIPFRETCTWALAVLKGNEGRFYRENPAAYERIVNLAQGRRSVARAVVTLLADQIDPQLPPQRILDTACGTGLMTDELARYFPSAHIVGMDISQPSLDYARQTKAGNVDWRCGNFENLTDVADESVDVYTMLAAYRHSLDKVAFFGEIARVLSPGGLAVVPKMDMFWFQVPGARRSAVNAGLAVDIQRLRVGNIIVSPFVTHALVMRKIISNSTLSQQGRY